ncbi:hypothetical protein Purlil1_9302 [Purpureocillium lilacinum]|uniref:Uncharacterized protein n=1 Tax=Purpureocillium lilacinum TaxID=33203 RepID=A0ABR0BR03_PURLI|nr:hypothetical protein Purlil1_9302 [Purpureocillium lilacinum]
MDAKIDDMEALAACLGWQGFARPPRKHAGGCSVEGGGAARDGSTDGSTLTCLTSESRDPYRGDAAEWSRPPPLFSVSWAPANFAFAFWANARPTPPEGEGEPERAKARPTCRPPGRQPVIWTVAYDAHDWHGLRLAAVPASPSDVPCVSASTGGASQDPDHASLLLASIPSRVAALHQPGRRARRAFGNGMQRAPDLAEDNAGILLQRAEPCALIVPRCGGRPARQAPASTAATVFSYPETSVSSARAPRHACASLSVDWWPVLTLALVGPTACGVGGGGGGGRQMGVWTQIGDGFPQRPASSGRPVKLGRTGSLHLHRLVARPSHIHRPSVDYSPKKPRSSNGRAWPPPLQTVHQKDRRHS